MFALECSLVFKTYFRKNVYWVRVSVIMRSVSDSRVIAVIAEVIAVIAEVIAVIANLTVDKL